jgi:hypothetical protein
MGAKKELQNYVQSLKIKLSKKKLEILILSESSLSKDWLKAEEDEAWKGL